MLKIIKDFCKLKLNNLIDSSIKEKLIKKYDFDDVNYAIDIINELNYDYILEIVIKEEKVKKFRNKKFIEKLSKKYKNNLPDQKETLEKIFNK